MSNASISNRSFLIPIAVAGIIGQCFLSIYFSGILAPKELITTLNSVTQLSDLVTKHRSAIFLDAWLMGIGSFLSVIFYIGLVYESGAVTRLSGLLTIIASAAVLAVALVDVTFMVAASNAAILGHTDTTKVAFDFVAGGGEAFDYTFIFGPAPMLIISIGIVLLRFHIIPAFFGYAAIVVGVMFFIAGLLSIFYPRASTITIVFEIVQLCRVIWNLTLAFFILIFRRGNRRVVI
jgi:Domain of unknown function (DUF4386)